MNTIVLFFERINLLHLSCYDYQIQVHLNFYKVQCGGCYVKLMGVVLWREAI
jgi:hypothetical protein